MRLPSRRVHEVDLLSPCLCTAGWIEKLDKAWLDAELGTHIAEIQVDCPIQALNLVLDEQRHFDVPILKELVNLLAYHLEVID